MLAYAIAAVVVAADWVTTALVVDHLHEPRHVWGPFGLEVTYNSGFAFSLFSGRAVAVTVLLCVGVAVLAVVVSWVRTVPLAVGAGLVLGGALGNLTERIAGGHGGRVPDFVTLEYWPTFNLADACVTVGVVIIIVCLLLGRGPEPGHDHRGSERSRSGRAREEAPRPGAESASGSTPATTTPRDPGATGPRS